MRSACISAGGDLVSHDLMLARNSSGQFDELVLAFTSVGPVPLQQALTSIRPSRIWRQKNKPQHSLMTKNARIAFRAQRPGSDWLNPGHGVMLISSTGVVFQRSPPVHLIPPSLIKHDHSEACWRPRLAPGAAMMGASCHKIPCSGTLSPVPTSEA